MDRPKHIWLSDTTYLLLGALLVLVWVVGLLGFS